VGPAPLERRTARTIVKIPELLKEIRSVEANKYAISDEELEIGLRSLAVPVVGRDGKIVAALSVSAASPRIRVSELRKRFLPILAASADLLSQRLAVV
jgi:IclR family pca regulon transcriptional regulator